MRREQVMRLLLVLLPRLVRSNGEGRALLSTTGRCFLGSTLSTHRSIVLDGRHLRTGRSGEHAADGARARLVRLWRNLVHHIVMRLGRGSAFLKPTTR